MAIFTTIEDLIGNTPLFEVKNIEKNSQSKARILVKLERSNPAGSAKDRVALQMILDAEKNGLIHPGDTIIEPTSGNTGIGLASLAAAKGYRAIFVMPENMSRERQLLLKAYGAKIVLTDKGKGMAGAIAKAEELHKEIPSSFVPDQFQNPSNSKAHYRSTAREIWEDTEGKIDVFIATVGTGGTITGTGQFLKEKKEDIEIWGIEPKNSPVLSGGKPGLHGIQGIGAGFIPKVLDAGILDHINLSTEEESYECARRMAREEGILVGISSGAALSLAIKLSQDAKYEGKTIVALLPDSGERYLSTPLFEE